MPPQLIVSGIPTNGTVDVPYNGTLSATGGDGTYQYIIWLNSLPAGLTLTNNILSGIPTTRGTYEIGIQVNSASMTDQEIITIVIE